MNRILSAGACGLVLVITSGCVSVNLRNGCTAEQLVTDTFNTPSPPIIHAEMFNGPIEVFVATDDKVHVKVSKRGSGATDEEARDDLENIEVAMSQKGDSIVILAKRTDRARAGNSGASAELQVPPGTILELVTSNGSVQVVGAAAKVGVKTSNGRVTVKQAKCDLNVVTSNGAIHIEGGRGKLDLTTSNGTIDAKADAATLMAHTSNGKINFNGSLASGEHTLQSSNGSIHIGLPETAQFTIDATTSNGKIREDFGVEKSKSVKGEKNVLRGSVGANPESVIKARTSNGSIELKKIKE